MNEWDFSELVSRCFELMVYNWHIKHYSDLFTLMKLQRLHSECRNSAVNQSWSRTLFCLVSLPHFKSIFRVFEFNLASLCCHWHISLEIWFSDQRRRPANNKQKHVFIQDRTLRMHEDVFLFLWSAASCFRALDSFHRNTVNIWRAAQSWFVILNVFLKSGSSWSLLQPQGSPHQ